MENIPILLAEGARVKAWDPIAKDNFMKIYPSEIEYHSTIESTIEGADLCFIFTEWPEIKAIDPIVYSQLMRKPIVLDGRNCYKLNSVREKGLCYDSIGREVIRTPIVNCNR